mgnify:CR=1 FL=1
MQAQVGQLLGASMIGWMGWCLSDMYLTAIMVLYDLYGHACITGADEV